MLCSAWSYQAGFRGPSSEELLRERGEQVEGWLSGKGRLKAEGVLEIKST